MDTSSTKHTLDDLFHRAVHLERQAGRAYALWATRFSSTPQVSTVWKGLMKDLESISDNFGDSEARRSIRAG